VDAEHGNVRVIDEDLCNGCKDCIDACPYIPHRTIWNPEKEVVMKCDLCVNTPYWNEEGGPDGKQACVEVCPMNALKLVKEEPKQVDIEGYDVNLRHGNWPLYMGT
jgi:protein NrfC